MKVETKVFDGSGHTGERIVMGIDKEALTVVMGFLTDLYSDPELAVVREYSTNAFDAHVEACVTRPIEVTTPTDADSSLRIRDYGFGLNEEDIRVIYSRYGTSTKRESDDVVGMLGLGSKSGLTYCDEFFLTGIKNGVCTQLSIGRDEEGAPIMTVLAKFEDNFSPSGVEIVIPAKRDNTFEETVKSFFSFWTPGTVLVNGVEPEHVDGLWIADDLLLTKDIDRDYVVMGNVAYPTVTSDNYYSRWHAVAFVNIGDVNFTPSRESLQMTAKTQATLATIKNRLATEKTIAIEKLIADAPNHIAALQIFHDSKSLDYKGVPLYKGQPIPETLDRGLDENPFTVVSVPKQRYENGHNENRKLFISNSGWSNFIWLVGYTDPKFTVTRRAKLIQWAAQVGLPSKGQYVLVDKLPDSPWINGDNVYQWADVAAQKLPSKSSGGGTTTQKGRPTGSYVARVGGVFTDSLLADDIDTSKPIFWISMHDYDTHAYAAIQAKSPDATLVYLGYNRVKKFMRDFPQAQKVQDWAKKLADDWSKSLDRDMLLSLHLDNEGDRNELKQFDADRIADKQFAQAVKVAKTPTPAAVLADHALLNVWMNLPEVEWTNPMEKYPLLSHISFRYKQEEETMNHIYTYINAAYAAEQKN